MDGLVSLLSALLTPIIAIIATYIAVQQFRLTKLKSRYELYDRRSIVYKAIIEFISLIVRDRKIDDVSLNKFVRDTAECHYLFKNDIREFVEELYKKALELGVLLKTINEAHRSNPHRVSDLADEHQNIIQWYNKQFEVTRAKFKRYLDLSSST